VLCAVGDFSAQRRQPFMKHLPSTPSGRRPVTSPPSGR